MQHVVKHVGFIGRDTFILIHTECRIISQQRAGTVAVCKTELCLMLQRAREMTREQR